MAQITHEIQLIHESDTLSEILITHVPAGGFESVRLFTPKTTMILFLPVGWHEMMLKAIREAYPSSLCPVCYSIHIAGTACETHDSYVHITDPHLESPVS